MWEEQERFRGELRCLYPTVWFVEDVCCVGWHRIVGFYRLLQGKRVLLRGAVSGGVWREKRRIQAGRASIRRFFSSPLTGLWKNVLVTECILNWSPGAWDGQVWLNDHAKNGSGTFDTLGSGFAIGTLAVADVGGGGWARKSGSMPGIKTATALCMKCVGNNITVWSGLCISSREQRGRLNTERGR